MPPHNIEDSRISVVKVVFIVVSLIGLLVPAALAVGHYKQKIDEQEVRLIRIETTVQHYEELYRDTLVLLGRMDERLAAIERALK